MRSKKNLENSPIQNELLDGVSDVAVLELPEQATEAARIAAAPRCEKCAAPLKAEVVTICRNCGWYASLGTFVEIDHSWETYAGESAATPQHTAQKSHLRVWMELIPKWGWIMIVSVLAVILESIAARLVTSNGSATRTLWSITQLAVGLVTAAICHVFNFVVLAAEDADFGVIDIVLRPVKLWIRAFQRMPSRLWVANAALCGLVASLMSIVVIGGLPYDRFWDWGFEEPVKQDLLGAVVDRAKEIDSRNASLEEAIGDFAGTQHLDEDGNLLTNADKARKKADCVILGYQVDREGRLSSLVLGTAYRGELVPAGRVVPELPEDERAQLLARLVANKTLQSFIRVEADATWVRPTIACRVNYVEQLKDGQLRDVEWVKLLGTVNTK